MDYSQEHAKIVWAHKRGKPCFWRALYLVARIMVENRYLAVRIRFYELFGI